MIESTFLFLPGIGSVTERKWWSHGIDTWDRFLQAKGVAGLSAGRKALYDDRISVVRERYGEGDVGFFARQIKPRDQWRLYEWLRASAVYLDIETAGPYGDVTVVGLYDGRVMTSLVAGDTLTEDRLCEELSRFNLILTFFGSGFDLPYLRARYPRLRLDLPHIDLCFTAKRLGLRGGLKQIERHVGIERATHVQGLDGWDAVRLWTRWRRSRDPAVLDLLLAYNEADCMNLQPLADFLYCRLAQKCRPALPAPAFSLAIERERLGSMRPDRGAAEPVPAD